MNEYVKQAEFLIGNGKYAEARTYCLDAIKSKACQSADIFFCYAKAHLYTVNTLDHTEECAKQIKHFLDTVQLVFSHITTIEEYYAMYAKTLDLVETVGKIMYAELLDIVEKSLNTQETLIPLRFKPEWLNFHARTWTLIEDMRGANDYKEEGLSASEAKEKYITSREVIFSMEIAREMHYECGLRMYDKAVAFYEDVRDASAEYIRTQTGKLTAMPVMAEMVVGSSVPREGSKYKESDEVVFMRLQKQAEIILFELNSFVFVNGKPLSVCLNDARRQRFDDLEKVCQRLKQMDPTFVIAELPPREGMNPSASSDNSSSGGSNDSSSGGCYVATAVYGSYDCPEVWTLRRYRDDTLASTWYGRAFIRTYYKISPTLVKWFGKTEWFKNMWKPTLDRMVQKLNANGVENTPYNDREY
ncbi:MAG: hypothetical protein E7598_02730 [Ruminococcaceae bacterium]|nr:hypothetical protein [Oscillospiraceae bacterium]